ncbi:MAG: hypothetical protein A3F41_04455 [Coxiella sp. RIFCSPHIGHO2_12_FULL_44_14]|nr:MAG: hypothetical protein A3F41_04455 [Coxiella sp. RIFCSPHIGHO2_12_FULL_44_14]
MANPLRRYPHTAKLVAWTSLLYLAYVAVWITFKWIDQKKGLGWNSLDTSMIIGLMGLTVLFVGYTYTEYRIENGQLGIIPATAKREYGSGGNTLVVPEGVDEESQLVGLSFKEITIELGEHILEGQGGYDMSSSP